MKRYIFRNKYYKIIIENLPKSILIQLYDKYGIRMSAISENYDELNKDIEFAIYYMNKSKCARKWLKNQKSILYYYDY